MFFVVVVGVFFVCLFYCIALHCIDTGSLAKPWESCMDSRLLCQSVNVAGGLDDAAICPACSLAPQWLKNPLLLSSFMRMGGRELQFLIALA